MMAKPIKTIELHYPMIQFLIITIIIRQGKSERSDWFFLSQDSAIRTVSIETVIGWIFFVFESRQIQNKHGHSAL